ncbi:DUF6112 family protein [Xylanimonas ulmi]|uniref:Uncharacterized protein n=1 Tax=Xylanimonas ulmi TaxID=228973 RepID=A0A4Q7M025_9MICO|nr:DUF6112 family protein [Xylanibacterium ulmi]RZS60664.1 hypothetical protein EV386_0936 [Xylanibacterium ulmi]
MSVTGPVKPDPWAVDGSGLYTVVGALLTVALITAVATIVTCSVWWALAVHGANWHQAERARTGVFLGLGGAALTGCGIALANWLINLGMGL